MGVVDVCVTVLSPTDICGFPFAFNVSLSISDGTAGKDCRIISLSFAFSQLKHMNDIFSSLRSRL